MRAVATDQAAKRLLVGSVGSVWIVVHTALLRRISALHSGCLYASFGSVPGDLLRDVREIGSTHIRIHGSGLVLHRGNRQLLIGKLVALVFLKALIDGAVDLPTDMAAQALPALAAGGRKLLHPFLFETLTQFGLASALLSITLLALS